MTNLFALLEESPRPWLDPEALKAKYHELTSRQHPDVAGASADFADINRAYQTLADPAARLRHLLDLETPGTLSRTQPVPEEIAAFFTPVAAACESFDAFQKKLGASTSPLAKALLSTEQYQLQETLEQIISTLQQQQETLLLRLGEADALWQEDRAAALQLLPALWQSLGYTAKWLATLRESLFNMASL
jgi:DnaJ-domain-containing protein 1